MARVQVLEVCCFSSFLKIRFFINLSENCMFVFAKPLPMEKPAKNDSYSEYDNFVFHPYNVMLLLVLFAISALFLTLAVAFIYTRVQSGVEAVKIPLLFGVNTLFLLGGSYALLRAKRAFQKDEVGTYQRALQVTFWLTLVFLVMQLAAWNQLFNQNIFLHTDNSAGFLYVLSFTHFAHVIVGLPFLLLFIRQAKWRMREPVTVLVYFSDPENKLKLRLLSIYWHFLDGLWIFLVLFLLVNQFIA